MRPCPPAALLSPSASIWGQGPHAILRASRHPQGLTTRTSHRSAPFTLTLIQEQLALALEELGAAIHPAGLAAMFGPDKASLEEAISAAAAAGASSELALSWP